MVPGCTYHHNLDQTGPTLNERENDVKGFRCYSSKNIENQQRHNVEKTIICISMARLSVLSHKSRHNWQFAFPHKNNTAFRYSQYIYCRTFWDMIIETKQENASLLFLTRYRENANMFFSSYRWFLARCFPSPELCSNLKLDGCNCECVLEGLNLTVYIDTIGISRVIHGPLPI